MKTKAHKQDELKMTQARLSRELQARMRGRQNIKAVVRLRAPDCLEETVKWHTSFTHTHYTHTA